MTRPTSDPTWATDANYPAGSDPWSGQPTRSVPSSGKRGTGYVPGTDDAAEEDNDILGVHGDWIEYLDGLSNGIDFDLADDFAGAALDANTWSFSTDCSIADDSANGAMGAFKIDTANNDGIQTGFKLAIGTDDFAFTAIVRWPTIGTSSTVIIGLDAASGSNDANRCAFGKISASNNWYAQVDGNGSGLGIDTTVAISSSYQKLRITRYAGAVNFYINDFTTPVYTTTYAGSMLSYLRVHAATGTSTLLWTDLISARVTRP